MNFIEDLGVNGHLQIAKTYGDGREEIIFDDHNIIVSGMGFGLVYLFAGLGSKKITDYQIDRVQLGVSGGTNLEVSTTYQLSSPLTSISQYGVDSDLFVLTCNQILAGVPTTSNDKIFLKIPFSKITRINDNSVRFTIVIDEEACNNITLNEIGLFMKNPTGLAIDASNLVAYRAFSSIAKTDDFGLIFRWTINF